MMVESDGTADATRRLNVKKQTLDDAYAVPANFLEIDVVNPMTTITAGKKRYTDYEVRMKVKYYFNQTQLLSNFFTSWAKKKKFVVESNATHGAIIVIHGMNEALTSWVWIKIYIPTIKQKRKIYVLIDNVDIIC